MSFSKAPIQRFNDNKKENSDSPSPSRSGTSKTMIPGPSHRTSSSQVSQVSQKSQSSPSTTSIKKSTAQIRSESTETQKDAMKRISKTSLRERPVTPLSPRGKIPVSQSTVQRQAAASKKPTTSSFIDMSPLSTPTHMKSPSKPVHNSDKTTKRILETRFHTKKKQFENMKKELCGKQKSLLDLYSGMLELRERAIDSTGTDLGPLEEIKLVDLSTMKAKLDNTNLQTPTQPRQAVGSGEDPAALNSLFVNKGGIAVDASVSTLEGDLEQATLGSDTSTHDLSTVIWIPGSSRSTPVMESGTCIPVVDPKSTKRTNLNETKETKHMTNLELQRDVLLIRRRILLLQERKLVREMVQNVDASASGPV